MTVRDMLRRLTSTEITQWKAFYKVRNALEQQEMGKPELLEEIKAQYNG